MTISDPNHGIVLLRSSEILGIVRSALSKIDPRLVDHGERVGFIASKIREECPDQNDFDFSKLYALCLLHDIGAYKTNEIDEMVRFETEAAFDHSLYGYLFLKNTSHLSKYAEAILYHHTDYHSPLLNNCPCRKYAELIHLADRADILLANGSASLDPIRAMSGTKFNPVYVDALFRAEEKQRISSSILSDGYRAETKKIVSAVAISSSEIMDCLKLLVYAIDFRSPYTVTHTADTTLISLEIGRLLELNGHDLEALYLGAFLHDIGKIAIPQNILEKPARLTAEEYAIIQKHIPEGESILRGVVSDEIFNIALRHHEKLDGSGYSHGLSGDQLTLPQRILAVADILSALSQQRSYKPAFPKEQVLAILTDMKQTNKLCPITVDTVCKHYNRILYRTEQSHDPVKTMYADLVREYHERSAEMAAKTREKSAVLPSIISLGA